MYLRFAAGPLLDFFNVGRIALDAQPYLFQTSLLHYLFGHITIFNVLEKAIQSGALYRLTVLFAHLGRILLVPVDHVVVEQIDNVTLAVAALRRRHHQRQNEVLEEDLELASGALVA